MLACRLSRLHLRRTVGSGKRNFSTFWGGNRWETKGYPLHFLLHKTKYDKLLDMAGRKRIRVKFHQKLKSYFTYSLFIMLTWHINAQQCSRKSWYLYGTDVEYWFHWGPLPREWGCNEAELVNSLREGPGPRIASYYPDYPDWALKEHMDRFWGYCIFPGGRFRPPNVPFDWELEESA